MNVAHARSLETVFADLWRNRRTDAVILIAGVLLGAFFDWNIVEICIFLVFLWSILGPIPSRVLAVPALFFLSATPVLIALEREEQAETFAVYAYYFLAMAVIRGIVELRSDRDEESAE
jgi:hypothetical protein